MTRRTLLITPFALACGRQLPTAPGGVRIVEPLPPQGIPSPAPLYILSLATSAEQTRTTAPYNTIANSLGPEFTKLWHDLPAHGSDSRPGELPLNAWARRFSEGEDVVQTFLDSVRPTLPSPARIVVTGVSRGGFMALHLAKVDPRIIACVALVPVTELSYLTEFRDLIGNGLVSFRALTATCPISKPLWVSTTEEDLRVSSLHVRNFVLTEQHHGGNATLHIEPGTGHNTPKDLTPAITWIKGVTQ